MAPKTQGYAPPTNNYTRIPHKFFEQLDQLNSAEIKLLLAVFRFADSERRRGSLEDLCLVAGLSLREAQTTGSLLIANGHLTVDEEGYLRLKVESKEGFYDW